MSGSFVISTTARRVAALSSLVTLCASCAEPTVPTWQIQFAAGPVVDAVIGTSGMYRIVVMNGSDRTVWLNACDRRAIPTVTIITPSGAERDGTLGGCLAIYDSSPIAVASGETFTSLQAAPPADGGAASDLADCLS